MRRALVLAATAAALLPGPAAGAVPEGRLPPRPVEIVSAPDVPEGEVRIDPAVVVVTARPGEAAQPEFAVNSGVDGTVTVELSVRPVVRGGDGAPTPGPPGSDGAAGWVTLPATEVFLSAGERALVRPAVDVPRSAEEADHVVARVGDAHREADGLTTTVVGILVIATSAGERWPPDVAIDVVSGRDPRLHLALDAPPGRAAVVEGVVEISGWLGASSSTEVPPTVVLPDTTRDLVVGVRPPVLPGPYRVSARLRTSDGDDVVASTSAWLWSVPGAVAALVVLLALGAVVVLARRRLRR